MESQAITIKLDGIFCFPLASDWVSVVSVEAVCPCTDGIAVEREGDSIPPLGTPNVILCGYTGVPDLAWFVLVPGHVSL